MKTIGIENVLKLLNIKGKSLYGMFAVSYNVNDLQRVLDYGVALSDASTLNRKDLDGLHKDFSDMKIKLDVIIASVVDRAVMPSPNCAEVIALSRRNTELVALNNELLNNERALKRGLNKVPIKKNVRTAVNKHGGKLSCSDVRVMRKMNENNISGVDISLKMGIPQSTISRVLNGETYKDCK